MTIKATDFQNFELNQWRINFLSFLVSFAVCVCYLEPEYRSITLSVFSFILLCFCVPYGVNSVYGFINHSEWTKNEKRVFFEKLSNFFEFSLKWIFGTIIVIGTIYAIFLKLIAKYFNIFYYLFQNLFSEKLIANFILVFSMFVFVFFSVRFLLKKLRDEFKRLNFSE